MPTSHPDSKRLAVSGALLAGLYLTAAAIVHALDWAEGHALLGSAILGVALIILSVIDIDRYRLPDAITLPLIALGWVIAAPLTLDGIGWHVLAAATGFLMLYGFSKGFLWLRGYPGLGLGDAKLLAASGAWLGLEGLPSVVMIASLTALAGVVAAAAAGFKVRATTRLPFGPFLAFATWLVWLAGPMF